MRRLAGLLSIVGLALGLAACSSNPNDPTSGLISASYPVCRSQGLALAVYLSSGNPTTDDANWGSEREQALSMSGQQRAVFIRQTADQYIQACDDQQAQAAQQAQAQASANAAASASAAAAAAQQQIINQYLQPECSQIGGSFDPGWMTCDQVPYYGSDGSTYLDSLKTSGRSLVADSSNGAGTSATQSECAAGYFPDASAGPAHGTPGHYAYGLCLATWN